MSIRYSNVEKNISFQTLVFNIINIKGSEIFTDYKFCRKYSSHRVKNSELRVVQIQAILFLKSVSEKVGSDIERLWIWMTSPPIDFESIKKFIIQCQRRSMSDPTFSDIDFKNKMAWVWTTLKNNP